MKKSQEIAHLASWELDVVNNILIWSDEVYRIFGLKPQEFGATYGAFLKSVHSDDRKTVDAAYSDSIRNNKDTYEIEHRVIGLTAKSASYTKNLNMSEILQVKFSVPSERSMISPSASKPKKQFVKSMKN